MATTQVQISLADQTSEIIVTSGEQYLLKITTQPEPAPGVTFNIKNITTFPDTVINSIILDSNGEGALYLSFHNSGNTVDTLELQALQDWSTWISSNIIIVHVLPATTAPPPPETCQPPNGVQRYCIDANTIAVWNQIDCRYDTGWCSIGKHCAGGYCVADDGCISSWRCESPPSGYEIDGCGNRRLKTACSPTTPPPPPATKKYKCVTGTCREDPTGTYLTPTCGGACSPAPPPPSTAPTENNTTTAIALVIAATIAAALILKKEKK